MRQVLVAARAIGGLPPIAGTVTHARGQLAATTMRTGYPVHPRTAILPFQTFRTVARGTSPVSTGDTTPRLASLGVCLMATCDPREGTRLDAISTSCDAWHASSPHRSCCLGG